MNHNVTIRSAKPEDAAEIAMVNITSWREAYADFLPDEFLKTNTLRFRERQQLWYKIITQTDQNFFVAESEDPACVVGYINGREGRDEGYQDHFEIYAFYLLQCLHKQGIGYRLLQHCFEKARKTGFSKAYLWVLKDNPTINFYEQTGARFTGKTLDVETGGVIIPELMYEWDSLELGGIPQA